MNSRLDTIQAAVLLAKMDAFIGEEIAAVNEVARRYDEALAGSGLVLPRVPEDYTSSWAQYTAQLPKGVDRTALQDALKERGVPTMVYYPKPMHEQGAFEGTCVVAPGGCSVTERLCAESAHGAVRGRGGCWLCMLGASRLRQSGFRCLTGRVRR